MKKFFLPTLLFFIFHFVGHAFISNKTFGQDNCNLSQGTTYLKDIDFSSPFINCNSLGGVSNLELAFIDNGILQNCIDYFTIDWGDSSQESWGDNKDFLLTNEIIHEYQGFGSYDIIITLYDFNGNSYTQTELFKSKSNPAGGINSPGGTGPFCAPTPNLTFTISDYWKNTEDTVYEVDFGDGTVITYTQSDLINSASYNAAQPDQSASFPISDHAFQNAKCDEDGYTVTLTITNECSETVGSVNKILVYELPEVEFLASSDNCVNNELGFEMVFKNENCFDEDFFGMFLEIDGVLQGPFSKSEIQEYFFNYAGDYQVNLVLKTGELSCDDVIASPDIGSVCVKPKLDLDFDVDVVKGCAPLEVMVTNNTDISEYTGLSCAPEKPFRWNIRYSAENNCGEVKDIDYLDGTNNKSNQPKLRFNTPGKYTLILKPNENSCGGEFRREIIVKAPPKITINPISDFCDSGQVLPSYSLISCSPDATGSLIENWEIKSPNDASYRVFDINENFTQKGLYSLKLTVTDSDNCGQSQPDIETFEILSIPEMNPINDISVCSGDALPEVIFTSNNSNIAFEWAVSSNPNLNGFLVSGTSSTIPEQIIYNSTLQNQFIDYLVTPKNGQCDGTPQTFKITVHPRPLIEKQPASQVGCEGFDANPLEFAISSGFNDAIYQWYVSDTSDNNSFTPLNNENFSMLMPDTSSEGTKYYYCEVIIPSLEASCQTVLSEIASITVYEPLLLTQQPLGYQEICYDNTSNIQDSDTLEVFHSGGYGQTTYQWYKVDDLSGSNKVAINNANTNSYKPNNINSIGDYYFLVEVSSSGLGCTLVTSQYAHIKITNGPEITEDPISFQELCLNASPEELQVSASQDLYDLNFQWFKSFSLSNDLENAQLIQGQNSSNFIPPTNQSGNFYYFCKIFSSLSPECYNLSEVAHVSISDGLIITSPAIQETFCLNESSPTLTATYINGVGIPTYQWYVNNLPKIGGASPISGANLDSFEPEFEEPGTFFFFCEITFPGSICGVYNTQISQIQINPDPKISDISLSICSGESILISTDDMEGVIPNDVMFLWEFIEETGKIQGLQNQNILTDKIYAELSNESSSPLIATYNVYPISSNCVGDPFKLQVEVAAPITVTPFLVNNKCLLGKEGTIELEVVGGSKLDNEYNYTWTGPNGFYAQDKNIYNLISGVYSLYVEDSFGCYTEVDFEILDPNIETDVTIVSQNESLCLFETPKPLEVTVINSQGDEEYQWYENSVSTHFGGSPTKIIGANSPIYNPEAKTPKTSFFYCEVTTACDIYYTNASLLEVFPKPIIKEKSIKICNETGFELNFLTDINDFVPEGTLFTWELQSVSNSILGANTNSNSVSSISEFKLVNQSSEIGIVEYTVFPNSLTCLGDPFLVTVMVYPTIDITANVTDNVCEGDYEGKIEIEDSPFVDDDYSYLWYGPEGFESFSKDIFNLQSGVYQLLIKSNLQCERQFEFEVGAPSSSEIFNDAIVNDISCSQDTDGSIILDLSGGIEPYQIEWEGPNGFVSNSREINNLSEGSYNLKVYNYNCDTNPYEAQYQINSPEEIQIGISAYNGSGCNESASGRLEILIEGGNPPYEILYESNEGSSGILNGLLESDLRTISGLQNGKYNITVVDRKGCSSEESFTIDSPEPLFFDVELSFDKNCEEGNARQYFKVNVYGGTPPFEYYWSTGIVSSTPNIMYTEQNGFIEMYVLDANNCRSSTYSYDVDLPSGGLPDFDFDSQALYDYGIYSVQDPVRFYNTASGDYINVSWEFGDGTFSSELNPTHIYKKEGIYEVIQTVTYASGCTLEKRVKISIDKGYKLIFPDAFTPNKDQLNDYFSPVQEGLEEMEFSIYDTWGGLIYFEKGNSLRGWDGTIRNKQTENGNYYYRFKAKTFYGNQVEVSGAFISIY